MLVLHALTNPQRTEAAATKRCPFCAEEIQVAAIVCRFCQRDLAPLAVHSPPRSRVRVWVYVALALLGLLFFIGLLADPPPSPAQREPTTAREREQLRQAILTSGFACDRVVRTFLQGTGTHGQFWNVACANGSAYVVTAGGSETRVMDCREMASIGGVKCFVRIEGQ